MNKITETKRNLFNRWIIPEYGYVETNQTKFKEKFFKTCSNNVIELMIRYSDDYYDYSSEQDNIFRIEQLSVLEYLALICYAVNANRPFSLNWLKQLFIVEKNKLRLRRNFNDLKKDEIIAIKEDNNSIYYFETFLEEGEAFTYLWVELLQININLQNGITNEYRPFYELYLSRVNLKNEYRIIAFSLIESFIRDLVEINNKTKPIIENFFDSIFVRKYSNDLKPFMNILEESKNKDVYDYLSCLFIFMYEKKFLNETNKGKFFAKLQRILGKGYKGFSIRNLYLISDNYFSEDSLELYNFPRTNKVIQQLQ